MILIIFAAAFLGICNAVPTNNTRLGIGIGDYIYFSNTERNRSRSDALAYCIEQGAELAKVWNNNIYHQIRVAASERGLYWVDGIDRPDEFRFGFSDICPHRGEFLDFSGMPAENLALTQVSCLSLAKGTNLRNSRIEIANCAEERFVICQYDVNGCDVVNLGMAWLTTTTTTTPAPVVESEPPPEEGAPEEKAPDDDDLEE